MAIFSSARRRSVFAGVSIAGCAFAATVLGAAPAVADSADIDVVKTASVSTAHAGDTVGYTVQVNEVGGLLSSDNNLTISDTLPPHMTYVAGSSVATLTDVKLATATDTSNNYTGGSGWSGAWVETNDDGTSTGGGIKKPGLGALRLRNQSATGTPSIARDINVTGTARSALVTFGISRVGLDNGDSFAVRLYGDNGTTLLGEQTYDGVGPIVGALNVSGLDTNSLRLEFAVLTGTSGLGEFCLFPVSHTGCSMVDKRFALTLINVTYVTETVTTWTNAGDPTTGLTAGPWNLGAGDSLTLTYNAVVDSLLLDNFIHTLTNDAVVTSDDDGVGEHASADVTLLYAPLIDHVVTTNGPVKPGQDLTVTVTALHDVASDGSPVCGLSFALVSPALPLTLVSGDDGDGCLEYGETWLLSRTITTSSTAGAYSITVVANGLDEDDNAVGVSRDGTFTVVLAETGTDESGPAAWSIALIAVGVGTLLLARRSALLQ